ncbi:MAG: hypothetical protein KIS76_04045 [Pyrinomonadaceae bacterium]|nr:hypothetical protein [Pyrinomonadaceae bacterium]
MKNPARSTICVEPEPGIRLRVSRNAPPETINALVEMMKIAAKQLPAEIDAAPGSKLDTLTKNGISPNSQSPEFKVDTVK